MQLMMECLSCLVRQAADAAMRDVLAQNCRTALMQEIFAELGHRRENLFFLFMAECSVVAGKLRVVPGTHLISGSAQDAVAGLERALC